MVVSWDSVGLKWEVEWDLTGFHGKFHGMGVLFFWIHGNAPLSPAESRNRPTLRGSKTSETRVANYFVYPIQHHPTVYIYIYILPIGSMVLLYMVTWIPSIYPLCVSIYTIHGSYGLLVGGLELFFNDCPFSWECHHPNWRTHIFQRGRLNHQPVYIYL